MANIAATLYSLKGLQKFINFVIQKNLRVLAFLFQSHDKMELEVILEIISPICFPLYT